MKRSWDERHQTMYDFPGIGGFVVVAAVVLIITALIFYLKD